MITSYEQGRFLEDALRSALEQDHEPLELIVVDGGSQGRERRDDPALRGPPRVVDERAGPRTSSRAEQGLRASGGDVLGWLASDDTLLPGAVARVVAELRREPEPLLVYGEALFVDEDGGELFPLKPRAFDEDEMRRRCENFVVQPGSLFTRRAWELAGPLDEDSHYLFDFEFALRVARHGIVRAIPDRLASYRVHAASKSGGASLLKARDYERFAERFLADTADGRASAYLAAGDYFYDARRLSDARRALVRSLRLRRSRRGAGLLARTLARSVMP